MKKRSPDKSKINGKGRIYEPIIPNYKPDSIQNLMRALVDIHEWTLARKIDRQTAGTAIHALEVLAKIMMTTGNTVKETVRHEFSQQDFDRKAEEMMSRV